MSDRSGPLLVALSAVLLTLGWQWATVSRNYHGNWTGLFCIGDQLPRPSDLESERPRLFRDSAGYDGQFYHYVAHDPLMRRDWFGSIDAPRLRYLRILVPALAWIAAAGQQSRIDAAYIFVILLSTFLGVWWCGRFSLRRQSSPLWGFAFLALPATVASIDRMVVDVALAAAVAGLFLYESERRPAALLWLATLAPLIREGGFLLAGGPCLAAILSRQPRRAVVFAAAAAPALTWYAFVFSRTTQLAPFTVAGFSGYRSQPAVATVLVSLDLMSLAGMVLALVLAWRWFAAPEATPVEFSVALFIPYAMWLAPLYSLTSPYDFPRLLSPLLLALFLKALQARSWVPAVPLLMVAPRTAAQLGPELLGLFR